MADCVKLRPGGTYSGKQGSVVAIDYETGEVVWKVRTGAGYSYNDSYRAACLSPDGTFYQGTLLGNVILRDGE